MPDTCKILGEGSYGIVASPALPNINNSEELHYYPENVTKIMTDKQSYLKTLHNSDTIFNKIPTMSIYTKPYKRKMHVKNISNNALRQRIITKIKGNLSTKSTNNDSTNNESVNSNNNISIPIDMNKTEIYPIRMKNLGMSFF